MYVKFDEARMESARLKSSFEPAAHREYLAALEQGKLSVADCRRALTKAPADPQQLRRLHVELARLFIPTSPSTRCATRFAKS